MVKRNTPATTDTTTEQPALSQAARIPRRRAAEEKSPVAQQALGDRDPGRDRHGPGPAALPEVAAQAPQEPRADRVQDVADRPVGHQHGPGPDRRDHDGDPVVGAADTRVTARRAVTLDPPSGPETSRREPLLASDPHRQAADRRRNSKAEAAVERLKEKLDQAQAKRTQESEGEAAGSDAHRAAGQAAQGP